MTSNLVSVTRRGAVQIITINRPEARNAVNRPCAQALADAFRAFDEDESSMVAVLTGSNNTFCAGADLKGVATGKANAMEDDMDKDGPMGPSRFLLRKPVIAAISGYAVAGGLELACWCDMRVVEETAIMGVLCRRWGVPLIDGGTVRLPRLIGLSHAMDLILTGREVGGAEAYRIGLANRLVGHGKSLEAAIELAESLTKFPQQCMRNDRLSAYRAYGLGVEDALAQEFHRYGKPSVAAGAAQGAQTFVDRQKTRTDRDPNYKKSKM
eukprot:Clim_evm20s169 gene=Clim_evmTU20s169